MTVTGDILGQGWRYPVTSVSDGPRWASGVDKIRQSIWLVLSTAKGERLMLPEFGCGIHDLVFSANTAALRGLVAADVRDALTRWEPRVDVLDVVVEAPEDARQRLIITVSGRIRENNAAFNLVYPFFLEEGVGLGVVVVAELPDLDDRTFEEIRDELRLRIPRYTPEWTDWNETDPGITLIELFAWLAESIGYRLNQAPERCLLSFLDALGITPEPARPAKTDLTFTVRQGETRPIVIRERTVVASSVQTDEGPILFETERGVELLPLRLQSLQVVTLGAIEKHVIEGPATPVFRPFGSAPQVGNAVYLGLGPADVPVTFPQELTFLVDLVSREQSAPSSARLQWEYRASATDERWSPLATYEDETRAFTRRGYVRIAAPRNSVPVAGVGQEDRSLHWVRCRLAGGEYPPGNAPQVALLRYNTVEAVSLSSVTDELVGQSTGRTNQAVRLRNGSVLPDTVEVRTVPPPDRAAALPSEIWTRVRDLVESGPEDRHVTVDAITGELRFGDGQHGQVPLAGFDIRADYRHGGSSLANVPRGTVTGLQTVPSGVEAVTNLRKAEGGRDEETRESLRRSAGSRLRGDDDRAVTVEDYRRLARGVGGVADAATIAQAHPDYPGVALPGCVTVAVLPRGESHAHASPELIDAVETALLPARTVGTELFVRSVRFVEILVRVLVEVDPYASFGDVAVAVRTRIQVALHPAPSEGRATTRFGLDFLPTQLFGVVQGVADVRAVPVLEILVGGRPHADISEPVTVGADQIAVLQDARVDVRPRRDL